MPVPAGSTDGPLLQAGDLADFAGAPFANSVVLAVGQSIRAAAGWRIAPQISETVIVESDGGQYLFLPTMWLSSVAEVRDVTDPDNPVVLDGWSSALTPRFRAGCLRRDRSWPCGDIAVDITHGYASCPQDLLSAAAALAQDAKVNKATGGVRLGSLSINGTSDQVGGEGSTVAATIGRYRIPERP